MQLTGKKRVSPRSSVHPTGQSGTRGWQGLLFVLPTLAVLLLVITYPLLNGFYISLFDTNLINKWNFHGLRYYREILTDKEFYRNIWITLKFTVLVVGGHFVVGGVLATILNKPFPGRLVFRTIMLLPWVIPEVSVAIVFKWILNPVYGIMNDYLMDWGLVSKSVEWFSVGNLAFGSVVFICIWKGFPLVMLLVLAGLQSIPADQYEAARVDGATPFQIQTRIVIPSLKPVLLSSLILDTVWWFKHFTIVWLTTNGGPDNATNLISIDIFKQSFEYLRFGKGAAMAVLVFFLCYIIGFVQRRVLEDEN